MSETTPTWLQTNKNPSGRTSISTARRSGSKHELLLLLETTSADRRLDTKLDWWSLPYKWRRTTNWPLLSPYDRRKQRSCIIFSSLRSLWKITQQLFRSKRNETMGTTKEPLLPCWPATNNSKDGLRFRRAASQSNLFLAAVLVASATGIFHIQLLFVWLFERQSLITKHRQQHQVKSAETSDIENVFITWSERKFFQNTAAIISLLLWQMPAILSSACSRKCH